MPKALAHETTCLPWRSRVENRQEYPLQNDHNRKKTFDRAPPSCIYRILLIRNTGNIRVITINRFQAIDMNLKDGSGVISTYILLVIGMRTKEFAVYQN